METLKNKIDFAVIFCVKGANPNGDPLNGNRPRVNYDGMGEVSDVCLKRKIRNRLMEKGQAIFVQSDDNRNDEYRSLKNRAEGVLGKDITKNEKKIFENACKTWIDVRTFGQVFAYGGTKKGEGVSVGIRGPVSIHSAFSVAPVEITSLQITKSVSGEGDGEKKASDTMGMKHRVEQGVYFFCGSMNPQLAEKTKFSDEDAEAIKQTLPKLFENDASSARPEGSMRVSKVIWWKHNCKSGQYSSAKVHKTLTVNLDGTYMLNNLEGLRPEEIDGF